MQFMFNVKAVHLLAAENVATDALSICQSVCFLCTDVASILGPGTVVVQELEQLFLHQQPDWLSTTWRHLFSTFLWQILLTPQPGLMQ